MNRIAGAAMHSSSLSVPDVAGLVLGRVAAGNARTSEFVHPSGKKV